EERAEAGHGLLERRRAGEVLVMDAREARDRRVQRLAGVHEGRETLADGEDAVRVERDTRGADLDDALDRRVEPGGLQVYRDKLQTTVRSSRACPGGAR